MPSLDEEKRRRAVSIGVLRPLVEQLFGFVPTARTLSYLSRRLRDHEIYSDEIQRVPTEVLTSDALGLFRQVYSECYEPPPFIDPIRRDVDVINATNFALFRANRGDEVALPGLRSILQRRRDAEEPYELVLEGEEQENLWRFSAVMSPGDVLSIRDVDYEVASIERASRARGKLICVRVDGDGV